MDELKTESFDIQEYLTLVKKNRLLILACVLAGAFLALIFNESRTPIYSATVRIEVRSVPQVLLTQYAYVSDWWTKERDLNTQFEILRSPAILERVVRKARIMEQAAPPGERSSGTARFFSGLTQFFGLSQPEAAAPAGSHSQQEFDAMVASLCAGVTIEPVKDTNLADITIKHSNPTVAFLAANTIAKAYEDFILETRFDEIRRMMNIYTDQLVTLKKTLRESEEDYLAFIQRAGISSLQEKKEITLEGLSDLKLNYTDTKIRRAEVESDLDTLQGVSQESDLTRLLQAPLLDKNTALNQLKLEILNVQFQLQDLQKRYRPQHPEVTKKESLLQSLVAKFRGELDTYLRSKRAERDALIAKENELARAIRENESIAIKDSSVALQYKKFKDELDSNKTLYETLLNKIKELDITKSSRESSIQVVEQPARPVDPISPRKGVNLLLGLLLGLLTGVGLAFGLEYLDQTLRNTDQVKHLLKLPTIAMIGQLTDKELAGAAVPLVTEPSIPGTFQEAFRFLKTNLTIATLNRRHTLMMITSTGSGEGKTTTAVNLALSFAREGKDVLLVDLDLRRPKVHAALGIDNRQGFTDLMVDPFTCIPLSGSLESIPLSDLIYLLIHLGHSGRLTVETPDGRYEIVLVKGRIALVDSSQREEHDRLGRLLVNKFGFPETRLADALQEAARRRQRLGEYLYDIGAVELEPVIEALRHQFTATFHRLLPATAGTYRFEEREDLFFHPEILQRLEAEKSLADDLAVPIGSVAKFHDRYGIVKSPADGLYVLTAGSRSPEPDEILSSERLFSMLDMLRKHFHTVIIDSPPSAMVSDSNTLSPHVDGIVYVVRYGKLPRKLIQSTVERLRANSGKIFGVVLNGVNIRRESYVDEYYYYSDYYRRTDES